MKSKPGRDGKKNVTASDSSQNEDDINATSSPQFHRKDKKLRRVHENTSGLSKHSSGDSSMSSSDESDDEHPINSVVHSQQESEYGTTVRRSELRSAVQTAPAVQKANDLKIPIDSAFSQVCSVEVELDPVSVLFLCNPRASYQRCRKASSGSFQVRCTSVAVTVEHTCSK